MKHWQVMLTHEPGKLDGVLRRAHVVTAHQCEHGRVHSSRRECADMGEARDPRLHAVDERSRAIDLAESPQRSGQIGHRCDVGVPSEIGRPDIFVAAGLEQGERPFEVIPRLAILAGEPASRSGGALRDARLGRIGSCLDVPEESRSVPPHRWQVATHVS